MFEKALAIDDHDYVLWGNLGTRYQHISGQETKGRQASPRQLSWPRRASPLTPETPRSSWTSRATTRRSVIRTRRRFT